jgi:hypothetical protein
MVGMHVQISRGWLFSGAIGTVVGQALWIFLRWLMKGLAEDRIFSGLNHWVDAHTQLAWLCWTALFIAAFVFAYRLGGKNTLSASGGIKPAANRGAAPLVCTVDASDPDCVVPNVRFTEPLPGNIRTPENATFFRVKVELNAAASINEVDGCRGRLLKIERDGRVVFPLSDYRLPFVTHGIGNPFAMRIRKGEPECLEAIIITDENEVWLTTKDFAHRLAGLLTVPGEYVFHIVITTPLGPVQVAAAITWRGDRAAAEATWRGALAVAPAAVDAIPVRSTLQLSPPQERLLALMLDLQRKYAASKLVIGRKTGAIYFDKGHPSHGTSERLVRELYGSEGEANGALFESLVESLPPDFVRFFAEARFDNPFVVSVTEAGQRYLANMSQGKTA